MMVATISKEELCSSSLEIDWATVDLNTTNHGNVGVDVVVVDDDSVKDMVLMLLMMMMRMAYVLSLLLIMFGLLFMMRIVKIW